jgi:hypothetical protein
MNLPQQQQPVTATHRLLKANSGFLSADSSVHRAAKSDGSKAKPSSNTEMD